MVAYVYKAVKQRHPVMDYLCFYMRRANTHDNTVAMTCTESLEISQQLLIDEPAEKLTRARGACLTPLFSLSKTN